MGRHTKLKIQQVEYPISTIQFLCGYTFSTILQSIIYEKFAFEIFKGIY